MGAEEADAMLEHLVVRSHGLTGADVVNVCQRAALLALAEAEQASGTVESVAGAGVVVRKVHLDRALEEALVLFEPAAT